MIPLDEKFNFWSVNLSLAHRVTILTGLVKYGEWLLTQNHDTDINRYEILNLIQTFQALDSHDLQYVQTVYNKLVEAHNGRQ